MTVDPKIESRVRRKAASSRESIVAVVGAGVSGCACAGVLANEGVRVVLLNSALDAVGLPGYGPDVVGPGMDWDEIEEALTMLPPALRDAWLCASSVPEDGSAVLNVDRRAVSIEAKRALEGLEGLEFRQGLVTGVRLFLGEAGQAGEAGRADQSHPARVAVETAFGEVIEADGVVLAVGLGLGGRVTVGENVMPGGRYGEIPADGLRESLERMGVAFRTVTVEVGARLSGEARERSAANARESSEVRETVAIQRFWESSGEESPQGLRSHPVEPRGFLETEMGSQVGGRGGAGGRCRAAWPDGFPPAAHWTSELRSREMVLGRGESGERVPLVSPDGMATAEWYLSPGGSPGGTLSPRGDRTATRSGERLGFTAGRLGHSVRGLVVASMDESGRLALESGSKPSIWVAGRAAGAAGYVESLRSGTRVGHEVARVVGSAHSQSSGISTSGKRQPNHRPGDCRATGDPGLTCGFEKVGDEPGGDTTR